MLRPITELDSFYEIEESLENPKEEVFVRWRGLASLAHSFSLLEKEQIIVRFVLFGKNWEYEDLIEDTLWGASCFFSEKLNSDEFAVVGLLNEKAFIVKLQLWEGPSPKRVI